jgi:hypothetical protein
VRSTNYETHHQRNFSKLLLLSVFSLGSVYILLDKLNIVHSLTSVQITTLLTYGLFQGHSLYDGVIGDVQVGGILFSVVSGSEALMITPYYHQEVKVQPWGHKNARKTKISFLHPV